MTGYAMQARASRVLWGADVKPAEKGSAVDVDATESGTNAGTVLQDSLDEAFRPVEEGLKRLAPSFEAAFPIWLEIGRAANEAAERIFAFNNQQPKGHRLNLMQELQRRFPNSAAEIDRARRLATVVTKPTRGGFALPPAKTQLPKALEWAVTTGRRPPSCLKDADQLLRDYNEAHIPAYAKWLAALNRRKKKIPAPVQEPPATVYRRRWRYEAARATALEALAETLLGALTATGADVRAFVESLGDIRDAWDRSLRSETLLLHADDMRRLAEAEVALWAAQDAVQAADPEERLERQRDLGAAVESKGKIVFTEFYAVERGRWLNHALGTNAETTALLIRLHRDWPEVQRALEKRGLSGKGISPVTLEDALALVEPREPKPGAGPSDIFSGYLERHRAGKRKDAGP